MSEPDSFYLKRVKRDNEIEQLRSLRNECRAWMVDQTYIRPEDQERWWYAAPRVAYLAMWHEEPIGFAHMQFLDGRTWITLGLEPRWRGKGFGTRIYQSFPDTHALIDLNNIGSRKACEKAGYTPCPLFSIPGWVILCNDEHQAL